MYYSDDEIKKLYLLFKKADEMNLPKNVFCKRFGITYSKFYHLRSRFIADSYRYSKHWVCVAGGELQPLAKPTDHINFDEITKFLEIEVMHND
jgi:hypothetical protein